MVPTRTILAAALTGNVLFWASVVGFAALRPDYSHLTKAVSELGTIGAPNATAFNVLGYVLPGLLLAWCGWQIGRRILPGKHVPPLLLAAQGAALALAGVLPADMDSMESFATRAHMAAVLSGLLTPLGWLIFAITARRNNSGIAWSAILALLLFMAAFCLYGFTSHRGPVQRLTFAIALGWHLVAAWMLWRGDRRTGRPSAESPSIDAAA